ncbi:MAG: PAS domain S-box protein, partial [Nitrososphaera sp.]|nr:PAS domain S-box protein [Nitrososphaera sp.]
MKKNTSISLSAKNRASQKGAVKKQSKLNSQKRLSNGQGRKSRKELKPSGSEKKSTMPKADSQVQDHARYEDPYRFLVQHAPYGIGIIQKDKLVLANPTLARILGYRASMDIEGKPISEFVEQSSRRSFNLLSQRRLRGEMIPSRFEIQMYRADGSLIEVESSLTLGHFQGEPAVSCAISDITDRKELEKRLIDSERLFRNVVNSMVDALVITDLQGKVLDVNDGFEQLTGYSRREVYGIEIPYP